MKKFSCTYSVAYNIYGQNEFYLLSVNYIFELKIMFLDGGWTYCSMLNSILKAKELFLKISI